MLKHLRTKKFRQRLTLVGPVVVVFLAAFLAIGGQYYLKNSQDLRQQAAKDNGLVTITTQPASGTTLKANEMAVIDLKVNTGGVQTDGVQLTFKLETPTLAAAPTLTVPASSGLTAAYKNIEQVSGGYAITLMALPATVGQAFSSNQPQTFATLSFSPVSTTSVKLSFDNEGSLSTVYKANPPQDQLKSLSPITFAVATTTAQATPSPTPGTGGVITKQCNETCSQNSECANNLRCTNGRCRLATNPDSSICSPTTQTITTPTVNTTTTTTQASTNTLKSCNQSCSSNRDCQNNLRCYNGACRLATNPTSSTCSSYVAPATTTSNGNSGSTQNSGTSTTGTGNGSSSSTGGVTTSGTSGTSDYLAEDEFVSDDQMNDPDSYPSEDSPTTDEFLNDPAIMNPNEDEYLNDPAIMEPDSESAGEPRDTTSPAATELSTNGLGNIPPIYLVGGVAAIVLIAAAAWAAVNYFRSTRTTTGPVVAHKAQQLTPPPAARQPGPVTQPLPASQPILRNQPIQASTPNQPSLPNAPSLPNQPIQPSLTNPTTFPPTGHAPLSPTVPPAAAHPSGVTNLSAPTVQRPHMTHSSPARAALYGQPTQQVPPQQPTQT